MKQKQTASKHRQQVAAAAVSPDPAATDATNDLDTPFEDDRNGAAFLHEMHDDDAPAPQQGEQQQTAQLTQRPRCTLCRGNAGQLVNGMHNLCAARAAQQLPTPNLGEHCPTCNGAGTQGKGGVMLDLSYGPGIIARSIKAQFPPCPTCNGRGYTQAGR